MIRPATLADAEAILALVNNNAQKGLMLMKSPLAVYKDIPNYVVYEEDGAVVGCCRVAVLWRDIGEIASLAVADDCKNQGIGKKMVEVCLDRAKALGLPRVFVLTYRVSFFEDCGFTQVPRESLPHKVFSDCLNCPKVDCCDETALILDI
ncbi:MAG: N-acetyltransferase [Alphaproteobacteria bacterium]|nr:N-acetyltransferase [Alphaproteobacteria bacterium]